MVKQSPPNNHMLTVLSQQIQFDNDLNFSQPKLNFDANARADILFTFK